jgi:[ribosomal protein S18]-alanine N-acetyltransferase
VVIRAASEQDLPAIADIQSAAPEASQWNPCDYLTYECRVAEEGSAVVGFIVARPVAGREWEILNLAVDPRMRRQGIGRQLLGDILARHTGQFFLEVRESNIPARQFYEYAGFRAITKRLQYYCNPVESAIVMKLLSC